MSLKRDIAEIISWNKPRHNALEVEDVERIAQEISSRLELDEDELLKIIKNHTNKILYRKNVSPNNFDLYRNEIEKYISKVFTQSKVIRIRK